MTLKLLTKVSLVMLLPFMLIGCSEDPQETMLREAVAIEKSDECHLCGMIISNFPGPKGESFQQGKDSVNKFCSTKDLFAFLLQPENTRLAREVYVHDMSKSPWEHADDQYFIDAKSAWYVVGSSQKGAMGSSLASFSQQEDANAFSAKYGGDVYPYDQITIELIMQ